MVYFKTKNPIWVNLGESYIGRCWYILWTFGIFYGQLFLVISYIFPRFGMLYQKNLATLEAVVAIPKDLRLQDL
jgi:hypothetical protein